MFNFQGSVCVGFYYNMYGTGMGTLQVYLTRRGPQFLVFERSGNQGNQWMYARETVPGFNFGDQVSNGHEVVLAYVYVCSNINY